MFAIVEAGNALDDSCLDGSERALCAWAILMVGFDCPSNVFRRDAVPSAQMREESCERRHLTLREVIVAD